MDDENGEILAYFALSFKEIVLNTDLISGTQIKKMDGISKKAKSVKAYLIGQIGKNTQLDTNPLNLSYILNEIYNVIAQVQALIGGRVIILECEDQPKLIALYEKHGFKLIETISENSSNDLKTMYTVIIE